MAQISFCCEELICNFTETQWLLCKYLKAQGHFCKYWKYDIVNILNCGCPTLTENEFILFFFPIFNSTSLSSQIHLLPYLGIYINLAPATVLFVFPFFKRKIKNFWVHFHEPIKLAIASTMIEFALCLQLMWKVSIMIFVLLYFLNFWVHFDEPLKLAVASTMIEMVVCSGFMWKL